MGKREEHKVKTITREELKAKMDRGDDFVLLEVLGEASYRRAHVPGAIRFQDTDWATALLPDKRARRSSPTARTSTDTPRRGSSVN
jgi:hypothetical protein